MGFGLKVYIRGFKAWGCWVRVECLSFIISKFPVLGSELVTSILGGSCNLVTTSSWAIHPFGNSHSWPFLK